MNAGGNELGASVYSEAKSEYTKQLTLFILTPFHRFFMDLLTKAGEEEPNTRKVLSHYQDLLSQIPEWNIDKVERETNKIITESRCDYLEELVTAVFIAHTKILTAIRLSNKNKKVQITVPKLNHFVHRALTECGRLLWSSVFLFQSDLASIEKQKNHRQIEELLKEGIQHAISGLLPIKSILKDNIGGGEEEEEEEEEEKEEEKEEEVEPIKKVEEVLPEKVEEASKVEEIVAPPVTQPPVVHPAPLVEEPVEEKKEIETPGDKSLEQPVAKVSNQVEVVKEDIVNAPIQEAVPPTIVIEESPQVKFADTMHTHAIEDNHMEFATMPQLDDAVDSIKILDEDAGEISDIEDLDARSEVLGDDDFDTL